ncbi:unnamed protein product [Rotaria sordida]|uniref:Uncharacterized protein n=1 Tax=Rotaria sordida TaxID=392033 RepID=A0A819QKS7_9BILA|nr:unnamed protein product [Rotaria sordida]CAF4032594.1 unnamed protein product [Rotaria sordida]
MQNFYFILVINVVSSSPFDFLLTLRQTIPETIDFIENSSSFFGLFRYVGVASDHPEVKHVIQIFTTIARV